MGLVYIRALRDNHIVSSTTREYPSFIFLISVKLSYVPAFFHLAFHLRGSNFHSKRQDLHTWAIRRGALHFVFSLISAVFAAR